MEVQLNGGEIMCNELSYKNLCLDTAQIVVAGGGTAGSAAAIAAARSGMEVLIVEQFGSLGGTSTNGLVTPLMHTHIEGNPMCSSISDEINDRMIKMGYCAIGYNGNKGYFDPLILKFVLEEMASEAGVKILYYSYISDIIMEKNTIKGIIIDNKAGRSIVKASRVIDCTGDADIAYMAGVPVEKGNPDTGKNQPMSVRYMMSGIDLKKFSQFLSSLGAGFTYTPPIFHTAMVWNRNWSLEGIFKKALESGDITYEDGAYWQVFGIPGRPDALAFNCPEIFERVDGTNPYDLTNAQIYAKKAILRHLKFYKKYFPGFENSYITDVASQVGIRESRRIKGNYQLTDEDVILCRKFEDHIARSDYPVDIHGYDLKNKHIDIDGKDNVPYYEIPYRCLVPVDVKSLLVAGRCISASFTAQSSLRIQPTVRAIGEAAGIAAAMSISKGLELDQIDGRDVREEMIQKGATF